LEILRSTRLQNRFYGFPEGMAYFMGAITKDRPKDDLSNSLNEISRKLDSRIQESPKPLSVPSDRSEENRSAPIWLHPGVIIAGVAVAGLLIFLLLRRRKAQ